LALKELINQDIVRGYAPLPDMDHGIVTQAEHTVIIDDKVIITTKLLAITQTEFVKSFMIAIQLGAILAVVVLYWRKFFLSLESLKKIIIAFIPHGCDRFNFL